MDINDKSYGVILVLRRNKDEDKFLIIQHVKGHWGFPKGHLESGEKAQEAALRELKEETGIADIKLAELPSLAEKYSFEENGNHYDKTVEYFIAFTENDEVTIQESEIQNYKWATYKEALDTLTFLEAREVLKVAEKYIDLNGISHEMAVIDLKGFSLFKTNELPLIYKAKAVVINSENNIVLMNAVSKNKVSIPGGKMEYGESIYEALKRECKEETGYDISIITSLGYAKLYRKKYISITFVFIVNTVGEQGSLSLTENELFEGYEVVYKNIEEVVKETENYIIDNP
ncbi:MAG TPA: NUDIX domain-containing protein, partial [Candidatus Paceibacterota bacterium]